MTAFMPGGTLPERITQQHRRLRGLLREASVATPTSGVRLQAVDTLSAAIRSHLEAASVVVVPQSDDPVALVDDYRQLLDAAGSLTTSPDGTVVSGLDATRRALDRSIGHEDDIMTVLSDRESTSHLALLALDFGQTLSDASGF